MESLTIENLPNGHVQLFARPTWTLTILTSLASVLLIGAFAVGIWLGVTVQLALVLIAPLALMLELLLIYVVCFRHRYLLVTQHLVVLGLAEYDAHRVIDVEVENRALQFHFDNRCVAFFAGLPKDELVLARDSIREALHVAGKRRSV